MYINNEDFETWMQKLPKKLSEIGQDLKSLINTKEVFSEEETLLDNQDLAFLLIVSYRTLKRYRSRKNSSSLWSVIRPITVLPMFGNLSALIWTFKPIRTLRRSTQSPKARINLMKTTNDSALSMPIRV